MTSFLQKLAGKFIQKFILTSKKGNKKIKSEQEQEQEQIQTFLNNIKDQIMEAKQSYGGCYIAVMDYGGYQELDVEVSDGSIAGSFVCEKSLDSGRNMADELAERITAETGCRVYLTRSEWEYALESS